MIKAHYASITQSTNQSGHQMLHYVVKYHHPLLRFTKYLASSLGQRWCNRLYLFVYVYSQSISATDWLLILSFCASVIHYQMPSMLWRCLLGGRKGLFSRYWQMAIYFGAVPLHCCKKYRVMRCWRGMSGARCKWFAYDATATPSSLASAKSRMVYPSGTGLPRLSWKKGLLNVCVRLIHYHMPQLWCTVWQKTSDN